jgi:hypothetical protein
MGCILVVPNQFGKQQVASPLPANRKHPSTRPALIGIPYARAGKFHFPVFGGWAEETLCPGIAIANCPYYEQHGFSGKQTARKEDSVTSLEHMLTCMLFYSL